jgi:hypothetical protein
MEMSKTIENEYQAASAPNDGLLAQLLDLYRYLANKKTWTNKILYREYKKEIKSCLTITDLHFYMQDLAKCTRLRAIDQEKLMDEVRNKRDRILNAMGYI